MKMFTVKWFLDRLGKEVLEVRQENRKTVIVTVRNRIIITERKG
jgi:hypothetical protein